jgi:hypothetical protein
MKDPRERLSKLLSEPIDPYDQDWEWIVSDSARIKDYIILYKRAYLNIYERQLLMEMMLQGINDDKLEFGFMPKAWLRVRALLIKDHSIHKKSIEYWASIGSVYPGCYSWAIAKEMRKVYWIGKGQIKDRG